MTSASPPPRTGSQYGYSGTPLAKKLGIKEGFRVAVLAGPPGFAMLLDPLPADVTLTDRLPLSGQGPDIVIAFFVERQLMTSGWPAISEALGPLGVAWIAWPKKSSGRPTDITEDVLRAEILPTAWVDVKVCAIDATWSGLKFVLRKSAR